MPFKLVLKTGPTSRLDSLEKEFKKPCVKIGRRDTNDITLLERIISSDHAEIQEKGAQYVLVDMKSRNGTTHNGQQIEPEKEYSLSLGDEIGIGPYVFEFHQLVDTAVPSNKTFDEGATIIFPPATPQCEMLANELRRVYRQMSLQEPSERVPFLIDTIREAVESLDPQERERVLSYIEAAFPEPEYQKEQILLESPPPKNEPPPSSEIWSSWEFPELQGILCKNKARPLTPEDRKLIVDQLGKVLTVFLNSLFVAVKARQTFQQQIGADVTIWLGEEKNPIKEAQSSQEILEMLFDPEHLGSHSDKSIRQLEETLEDLAKFPMGIFSGLKECIHGLLMQLDPETFEEEARMSTPHLGPWTWNPLVRYKAWHRFSQKHRTMLQEEHNTVKKLLANDFVEGYFSVYKEKHSS